MDKSKEKLKKTLREFIRKMGKDGLAASLDRAGFEFYKNVKMPVFTDPASWSADQQTEITDYFNEMSYEQRIYSLPEPDFDWYELVQIPFRVDLDHKVSVECSSNASGGWLTVPINATSWLPCSVPSWHVIPAWRQDVEAKDFLSLTQEDSVEESDEMKYAKAA